MLKALIVKLCVTWLMRVWSHIIEELFFFEKRTVFSPKGQQSMRGGFVMVYLYTISDTMKVLFLWRDFRNEGLVNVKSTCVGEYAHM